MFKSIYRVCVAAVAVATAAISAKPGVALAGIGLLAVVGVIAVAGVGVLGYKLWQSNKSDQLKMEAHQGTKEQVSLLKKMVTTLKADNDSKKAAYEKIVAALQACKTSLQAAEARHECDVKEKERLNEDLTKAEAELQAATQNYNQLSMKNATVTANLFSILDQLKDKNVGRNIVIDQIATVIDELSPPSAPAPSPAPQ